MTCGNASQLRSMAPNITNEKSSLFFERSISKKEKDFQRLFSANFSRKSQLTFTISERRG